MILAPQVCLTYFISGSHALCIIIRDYHEIIATDGNLVQHIIAFYLTLRRGVLMLLWWGLLSFHGWIKRSNSSVSLATERHFEHNGGRFERRDSLRDSFVISWKLEKSFVSGKLSLGILTHLLFFWHMFLPAVSGWLLTWRKLANARLSLLLYDLFISKILPWEMCEIKLIDCGSFPGRVAFKLHKVQSCATYKAWKCCFSALHTYSTYIFNPHPCCSIDFPRMSL